MAATVAVTNYGTLLKKATTVIGEVVSLDPPSLSNPKVEATNHSSGGVHEYIPSKLIELSEFKAKINFVNTVACSGIVTDLTGSVVAAYSIVFPENTTWGFNAFPTSFNPESADASKPDALQATVTFQPTGTITLS